MVAIPLTYPSGLAGAAQAQWEKFLQRMAKSVEENSTHETELPLVVDDVRIRFGGVQALDGASISVRPGEIVGLIGPNGAGKTTLLNVISGVLRPAEASVRMFGSEVASLAPELRPSFGLGRSFQSAQLFSGSCATAASRIERAFSLSSLRHNK